MRNKILHSLKISSLRYLLILEGYFGVFQVSIINFQFNYIVVMKYFVHIEKYFMTQLIIQSS